MVGTALLGRLSRLGGLYGMAQTPFREVRLSWLETTIAETVVETPRVRTLVLDADGWSGHRAGQHVDVRLTAEDGYQADVDLSLIHISEPTRPY